MVDMFNRNMFLLMLMLVNEGWSSLTLYDMYTYSTCISVWLWITCYLSIVLCFVLFSYELQSCKLYLYTYSKRVSTGTKDRTGNTSAENAPNVDMWLHLSKLIYKAVIKSTIFDWNFLRFYKCIIIYYICQNNIKLWLKCFRLELHVVLWKYSATAKDLQLCIKT